MKICRNASSKWSHPILLHIIWENLTLSTWSRTNLEPAEHNRKNPGYKLEFQFHHNQSAHECSPLPESMKVHNLIVVSSFTKLFRSSLIWYHKSIYRISLNNVRRLKVSKFQKQIILSSHCPKNQRKFSHFLP